MKQQSTLRIQLNLTRKFWKLTSQVCNVKPYSTSPEAWKSFGIVATINGSRICNGTFNLGLRSEYAREKINYFARTKLPNIRSRRDNRCRWQEHDLTRCCLWEQLVNLLMLMLLRALQRSYMNLNSMCARKIVFMEISVHYFVEIRRILNLFVNRTHCN